MRLKQLLLINFTITVFTLCVITTKSTSLFQGVSWSKRKRKWSAQLYTNGQQTFGGGFEDELDAAKRVNQLCQELGIPLKNPGIGSIPTQPYQKREKTSQYKGVCWQKQSDKWYANLHINGKQTYGGRFRDELDAAKRVNQLCEESGIPLQNPEISAAPTQPYQKSEKTSQYKGVSWNKQNDKWFAYMYSNGKSNFGGGFKDELDAAKRVNQLCEELEIPIKNPEISTIPNQKFYHKSEKSSQYKGVSWHKQNDKWYANLYSNGKQTFGGGFKDELDAAKRVNQLCEELKIPLQNPGIGAIPMQPYQKTEKTSKYKGVFWAKRQKKWDATLFFNGKKNYGGRFKDELDAVKRVNQLCEEKGIALQNPGISSIPTQEYQVQDKTSIYIGVCWSKDHRKWRTILTHKTKRYLGGSFDHEKDAAMRINLLCDKYEIKRKNPTINIELDGIHHKIKSNLSYQSKEEKIVKVEEESILYGLKHECENNFMKSKDEKIKIKCRKRKRQEDSIIENDDIKEEKVETETANYDEN